MKKTLFLTLLLFLVAGNLCACNSSKNESNNSSSQSKYASDSVRYDCNGHPLNQYNPGHSLFGSIYGKENVAYRTQITEIVTKGNSATIYTYKNISGINNYIYFRVDNEEINVSGLNVHDWVNVHFNTDGKIIKIE